MNYNIIALATLTGMASLQGWVSINSNVATIINGMKNWPCLQGSGHRITQERPVKSFSSLNASGATSIILVQGAQEAVSVEGDDNIIDRLRTQVVNGQLRVDFEDGTCITYTKPIKVFVTARNIDYIKCSGATELECQDLSGSNLAIEASGASSIRGSIHMDNQVKVKASGASDVELEGTAAKETVTCSGSSNYHARNLRAHSTQANVSGASEVSLGSRDEIQGSTSGASSIRYTSCRFADID